MVVWPHRWAAEGRPVAVAEILEEEALMRLEMHRRRRYS